MPDNSKTCPSCARGNGQEALFCSQCGHRFETQKRFSGVSDSRRQCLTCGKTLGSFDVHCSNCASRPASPTLLPGQHNATALSPQNQNPNVPTIRQYPGNPAMTQPGQTAQTPAFYAQPVTPLANPNPHVQCGSCGQWIPQGSTQCQFCGVSINSGVHAQPFQPPFQQQYPQAYQQPGNFYTNPTVQDNRAPVQQVFINTTPPPVPVPFSQQQYAMTPYRAKKDKTSAGVLALLLGGFGAHHFYLGNTGAGILSVLFFWTYIPALVGMIQGIMYLCMGEEEFQRRYGKNS